MDIDFDPRVAAFVAALGAIPPAVYSVATGSYTGYVSAVSVLAIAGALYLALAPPEPEPQAA